MSAHSRAPWFVVKADEDDAGASFYVQFVHPKYGALDVCQIYGDLGEEDADADLIAAAPDLLAACEALVREFGDWTETQIDDYESIKLAHAAIARARAAHEPL